jgi:hypothetical protein
MSKLKVKGYDDLVRDLENKAIINTNKNEFQAYMNRHKAREKQSDQIRNAIKEINTLKQDILEIKEILLKGKQ